MSEKGNQFPRPGTQVNISGIGEDTEEPIDDSALYHTVPVPEIPHEHGHVHVPSNTRPAVVSAVHDNNDTGAGLHDQNILHAPVAQHRNKNRRVMVNERIGQPQPQRTFDCKYCGWRFSLKGNLLAHVRRHTGEKPYECEICHRKFTQSSLLTVHMRTHTGEKPFKCDSCGRTFSRSGNLHTHVRTHNDEKPYECAFCHKQFSQRVNMELHTRVHTGVKPYRCGVCDRAFTSCSNMRRHWRQIHPAFPEPALGTTHLQNGMPEKALYNVDVMRMPQNYRQSPETQTNMQPHLTQQITHSRTDLQPLIRENHDAIYAPMLAANSISNGMNSNMGGQYTIDTSMSQMNHYSRAPQIPVQVPQSMQPMPLVATEEYDPAIKEEEARVTAAAVVRRNGN
ncbi:Pzf1 protein [Starmerella bacillaris]|uniref:Pzf1 protein n=1 Tax=Starmerella bacillaris TaxID=1247836 RepID=A0AAV5RG82_STABA|nr:Pzf1 protein [Starmerella bacillaris]